MEETTIEGPKRPQFLTVLCVLTYIGVGVGILLSLLGWWGMNKMSEIMANPEMLDQMPDMDLDKMEKMMVLMKYANVILISGITGSIICLVGALQMWQQKKIGFFIYVAGEIGPVIVSAVCLGSESVSGWNVIGVIFPATFLVLYGLNFKHLS